MAVVLGVTAFMMALGALWFTSEALKRIDGNAEAALMPRLRGIEGEIAVNAGDIAAMERRLTALERTVGALERAVMGTAPAGDPHPNVSVSVGATARSRPSLR